MQHAALVGKTKWLKAGDRFFRGVKVGLIQKNHGLMEKVVEGFGGSEEML